MVPTVELPDVTPLTSQTTAVFVVPVTVARKATVWLTTAVGDWGATVTVIAPGLPPPPVCLASDKPLQPEKPAATTSTNKKRVARRIVSPNVRNSVSGWHPGEKRQGSSEYLRDQLISCTRGQAY